MAHRKRKVRFDEPEDEAEEEPPKKPSNPDKYKSEHSLDSDDESAESDAEEAAKRQYVLTEEDMHEDMDPAFTDGGVQVTPFNLKQEMEDGHFDADGTYVENKDDAAGDEWLEGAGIYTGPRKAEVDEEDDDDAPPEHTDKATLLAAMLEHVQPRESVAAALRRLGKTAHGATPSVRKVVKGVQPGQARAVVPVLTDEEKKSGANLNALTEAADKLLATGCFEVYQFTRERIAHELQELQQKAAPKAAVASGPGAEAADDNPTFEYKWTQEAAEVFGPFTAQQMIDWKGQGFFPEAVVCRETGKPNAPFYALGRIEFDLYTD